MPAVIVFSHLRWDFVYQRPQHLLSRLAQHYQIVFVEEPVFDDKESRWDIASPIPNVLVCQPHTSIAMPGFHDDQLPQMRKLMRQLAADYEEHIVWFYTPMALPLLQELRPRLVVYDCMDELASFKNAPKQLLERENAVLKVADIVFAGGPSLYRAKRERHPDVHCFPSSVDVAHFTQALDRVNSHPAHRDIPGPRLGFYGVIDERFDTELLTQLADAHPQWQVVLVGPIVRIDPAALPQRENIHYLGQQPYQALPYFLAGWDVCLLPFAINESTRFISPAKTLEYMAAELPIVSTPVTDVADLYRDIVYIAADAPQFIAACEKALLESIEYRAEQVAKMNGVVCLTSWDATVKEMHALLESAYFSRKRPLALPAERVEASAETKLMRKSAAMTTVKCAAIGAAQTARSAYHLDKDTPVRDRNSAIGK